MPTLPALNQPGLSVDQPSTGLSTTTPAPTGTATNDASGDGDGAKIAKTVMAARQQYPGQDDAILQAFIRDNQQAHPDVVQKVQSYLGTERTNRNNNPIAVSVKNGGHNEFTSALDQAGMKWSYGDPFPGAPDMSTIKIQGDPIEASRTILSNSDAVQNWYANHTGKDVLAKYNIKNNTDFKNANPQVQDEVIAGIKQAEGGSSKYSATQILNSLVSDNTTFTPPGAGDQTNNAIDQLKGPLGKIVGGVANSAWNGLIGAGKGINQLFNAPAKGIANKISGMLGVPQQNIEKANQQSDQLNQPNGTSQKVGAVVGKTAAGIGGLGATAGLLGMAGIPIPEMAQGTMETVSNLASKLEASKTLGLARKALVLKGVYDMARNGVTPTDMVEIFNKLIL